MILPQGPDAQFKSPFYVRNEGFEDVPGITGSHRLSSPIDVSLPVQAAGYLGQEEHRPGIRTKGLNSAIQWRTFYPQDNYAWLIDSFSQAENTHGWLDCDGKEILSISLGNAYFRRVGQELRGECLRAAATYRDNTLAIAPNYALASAGKGTVLYRRSLGDLSSLAVN